MNSIGQNATVGNLFANTITTTGGITTDGDLVVDGNISTQGAVSGYYNYDRSAVPTTFWLNYVPTGALTNNLVYRVPGTATNLEIMRLANDGLLSIIGSATQGATDKGVQLGDRALVGNSCWKMFNESAVFNLAYQGTSTGAETQKMTINNTGAMGMNHATGTANGTYYYQCLINNVSIGGIRQLSSTSTEFFNGVSDYRAKKDITPVSEEQSAKAFDALKPVNFTYNNEENYRTCGFLAHELQEVIPHAVFGAKDAVNADGTPDYQSVSIASQEMITLLVAEVQSLRKRMAALESK